MSCPARGRCGGASCATCGPADVVFTKAEPYRRPMLDVNDGRARCELAFHGLAVEPDRDVDVPATVQVQVGARRLHKLEDDDVVLERRLTVFEEDQRAGLKAVLLEEDFLDDGDGMVASGLDMFDFANTVALVVNVDC